MHVTNSLLSHIKILQLSQRKAPVQLFESQEQLAPPFLWNAIFTWKNDWQINYVSQTWIFGRHFLEHKQRKPVTSKQQQQLTMIFANDKIWAFELKLEFWKTSINQGQFDSFPICAIFPDEEGEINEAIFHNENCWHLKNLHYSVKQWAMHDITKSCVHKIFKVWIIPMKLFHLSIESSLTWFLILHCNLILRNYCLTSFRIAS